MPQADNNSDAMADIRQRLGDVRSRIDTAVRQSRHAPQRVRLIAVSKGQAIERLRGALAAGIRDFGESYLQEALPKLTALAGENVSWHFIGPLQSNKCRDIARHFDWIHSVDRTKIARRLSQYRPSSRPPLQICIQVNISAERTKAGVAPDQIPVLAAEIAALPGLRLRGLMAVPARPKPGDDPREPFRRLRRLGEELREAGYAVDTLSMGMSDDFEAAIAEGANLVRIGSALMGPRPMRADSPRESHVPG